MTKRRITHIVKEYRGWFCLEPIYDWVAYDWNTQVAQAKRKADCIRIVRERGYSVPHGM